MKFTRLSKKYNQLLKKKESGKNIKPAKVEKLLENLTEKKVRYEKKLESELPQKKRKSLKTRLKVINAQINKAKKLI